MNIGRWPFMNTNYGHYNKANTIQIEVNNKK